MAASSLDANVLNTTLRVHRHDNRVAPKEVAAVIADFSAAVIIRRNVLHHHPACEHVAVNRLPLVPLFVVQDEKSVRSRPPQGRLFTQDIPIGPSRSFQGDVERSVVGRDGDADGVPWRDLPLTFPPLHQAVPVKDAQRFILYGSRILVCHSSTIRKLAAVRPNGQTQPRRKSPDAQPHNLAQHDAAAVGVGYRAVLGRRLFRLYRGKNAGALAKILFGFGRFISINSSVRFKGAYSD